MAAIPDAIRDQLTSATVRMAPLVRFQFKSEEVRLWGGAGDLDYFGSIYTGAAGIGAISPITITRDGVVEEMEFLLFAPKPEIFQHIEADAEESLGRPVQVLQGFFDEDWRLIPYQLQLFSGKLGPLQPQRQEAQDGSWVRLLRVTAQNAFTNRSRPAFALCTDRDQKARYPDDNIFINVSAVLLNVPWPRFST